MEKKSKTKNKGVDLPTGLGAALYQNTDAMKCFESLTNAQKANVISYVRSHDGTKEDAKQKISDAVEQLQNYSTGFIN